MRPILRHITGLLVLLSLLGSTQGGLVARMAFSLRQDYIAQQLCENRFVPDSPCHGFCFLKKRLAETEQQRDRQAASFSASPVQFYLPVDAGPAPVPPPAPAEPYVEAATSAAPAGHPFRIDPPPRLA